MFSAVLDGLGPGPNLTAQARCTGLLGAVLKDLAPLNYHPADERYPQMLQKVQEIFTPEKAETIDFDVRLEAAEALGQHRYFVAPNRYRQVPASPRKIRDPAPTLL